MKYLVDSNVLSEGTKPGPDPLVVTWLRLHEQEIVIDPIVLGEIRFGIYLLPEGGKRTALERWFDEGVAILQCLNWTPETGLAWAKLLAELRSSGKSMPIKDSLVAATARMHGLTVVTRNVADFSHAGVPVFNPFSA